MLYLTWFLSTPIPEVQLPCGSISHKSTFLPAWVRAQQRFIQVVVLPTPPFWLVMAIIFLFISNMKLADIWHGDWFSEGVAFLWWEDKHGRYDFQPRLTCVKRTPQIWVHQGTENKSKWMDSHPVYIPESDLGEWPWKCWRLDERKWGKQLWPGRASQIWHTANFMMSS